MCIRDRLQDTHLFTGTIRENIRYGRLDATDAEVEQAAKMASAHSDVYKRQQLRPFRQEKQDERGRKQLGEHGCNCSALHAEAENKDKERVKEQIGSCADGDGAHTDKGISLCRCV